MNSRIVAVASLSCPAKTVTVFVGLCSFCVATATAAGLANPAAQPHVELITTKVVSSAFTWFIYSNTASLVSKLVKPF